ncbi:cytosolic protein [Peribacillus glennii]|uniref:Cytosolic protein n=1 Tax=Peribacillus glennii TaxID=2303991 RepID=A0A372LJ15_9BACI|nr:cytosolic protein [Peribacillus glennii]RFU65964.1 cytosolic protein [Peribacillus glennii]
MGLFTSITSKYSRQCETKENHSDEQLRTHYYKAKTEQALRAVEELYNDEQRFTIKSVSKDHGEIFAETKSSPKLSIVATCISVKPLETAVDFTVSTESQSLTGIYPKLREQVVRAYDSLAQSLTYTGSGKNA